MRRRRGRRDRYNAALRALQRQARSFVHALGSAAHAAQALDPGDRGVDSRLALQVQAELLAQALSPSEP
ncbi:MAG: hypothetical protein U1A78_32295 [Polyangia bacterium]